MSSASKPKTHNTLHARIKPGESWTLKSGDTIENLGPTSIFIRVKKLVQPESIPSETIKKAN